MPKDVWETKTSKKKAKPTAGSGGGWGYFDSIAAASNKDNTKKQHDQAVKQANSIARSQGWDKEDPQGNNLHQQAMTNANTIYSGDQTQGQIEAEKAGQVTVTDDGAVVPKIVTDKKKKVFTVGNMQVSERLYNLYQRLIDRGYTLEDAKKIIKLGLKEEEWADENLVDLMSGEGIKRIITKDFKSTS